MGTIDQGRDTYCLDTLVPGRVATGLQVVAQRLYHRLITPQGMLQGGEDEANFGIDLAGYVGSIDEATVEDALPTKATNELLKDPAVDSVDATATRIEVAGEVSWTLNLAVQTTSGDVALILAVSSVTVDLLGVH